MKHEKTKTISKCAGFTLIEVLVAMVIFSVGILAIAQMQIVAIKGNSSGRVVTDRVSMASQQIERIMTLPYDAPDLDPDDPDTDSDDYTVAANAGYTMTYTVLDDTPVTDNKTINLTVRKNGGFSQQSFTMQIIKSEVD